MDKIKGFIERNKDWLIPATTGIVVALIAPSLFSGPGRPRKGFNLRTVGNIIAIGGLAYSGYVIYKNWDRIKSELGM